MSGTHKDQGYSVPEMLVALAIVAAAVSIAFALPRTSSSSAVLRATAEDLVSLARLARAAAIRSGRATELVFDRAGRRYWVDGIAAPRLVPPAVDIELRHAGSGVPIGAFRGVVFTPEGTASGATLALVAGRQRLAVEVDWLTGSARIR